MKLSFRISASALCVSMLILLSCGRDATEGEIDYNLNSFDVIDLSDVEPERVSPPEMMLGIPFDMCMVSDSVLAFQDDRAQKQLWLLNVNSGKFANILYRGNGPQECLGVTNTWADDGYLFVGGVRDRKILKIAIDPDTLGSDVTCLGEIPVDFLKAVTLSDSSLIYAPFTELEIRFLSARMDGTTTDTLGRLPYDRLSEGLVPKNSMFQMQIALSPDKRHMVSSNLSWNITEIYALPEGDVTVLNGPIKIDSKIVSVSIPLGTIYPQEPSWSMFVGVKACNDGFAQGFVGRELKTDEDYEKYPETILFFDWNGNPTKMVKLGREMFDFSIDFASMTLYALVNDPEPMLVKYTIPVSYDEIMGK